MAGVPPEPFQATAADGKTALYGTLFRPSNLDKASRYPVVDALYMGPQSSVSRRFWVNSSWQAMAELGFIVVLLDGRGMSGRSKEFLDVAHRNIGFSPGFADHMAALKQLAAKYPYLDLTRVGATGHSAGGYDAARALLAHPEFYKVGVASAGNHDPSLGPAGFHELWMGYPVGDHYREQSNMALAKNLKGKLLLIHGELDAHVPVANSLRLAAALMEADKDFELILIPNGSHLLGDNRYAIRRTWDFFVKHLLGVEPPPRFVMPNLQRRLWAPGG